MYAKKVNNKVIVYPYTIAQLRADNPGTSFPEQMPDIRLAEWGVFPVLSGTPPYVEPGYVLVEETPVEQEDGSLVQSWQIRAKTEEEAQAEILAIRSERSRLLQESDWTQLPDSPVDPVPWQTYRQALRDITQQVGFPWNITWPVKPT